MTRIDDPRRSYTGKNPSSKKSGDVLREPSEKQLAALQSRADDVGRDRMADRGTA
jgi:hypothetical protein